MSKVPLVVGLQKIIQAFKKWLPFKPGEGESSLAQDGNQAFAVNGTALGYQTVVGSKGYRISAFTPGDKDEDGNYINGTYTLVLNQDELISQEIKGATYCIYLKQSKDSVGTISNINGNIITVDGFLYPAKWDEGQWEELDENGNKTGNTLTGDAWEQAKAEAFASSYIIFEGLPTIGNINVGTGAHAEGWGNIATQIGSHAEGAESKALGKYSHAEGNGSVAYYSAHSEGKYAKAIGYHSHAEGYQTEAIGMDSHAEGRTTKAIGQDSHAEGISTSAEGLYSHSEGQNTLAQGQSAHAEGRDTKAIGGLAHAEGFSTNASGQAAHAEGYRTISGNIGSHSEGVDTQATAKASHAEGLNSKATAQSSHAEGYNNTAGGENAHAEGYTTTANGLDAHSEGRNTVASGKQSHAQGLQSKAYGDYSHAGGHTSQTGKLSSDGSLGTTASTSGAYAFAHGFQAKAEARGSVALGRDVIANEEFQVVVGAFNDTSKNKVAFAVGTGTNSSSLKNGLTVYKDGRVEVGKGGVNENDLATVGQLAKKLDAYTNSGNLNKVYVAKKDGSQTTYNITTGYDASTVMMRDGNGASEVVTTSSPRDTHIANVGFVNKAISPLGQRLSFLEGGLLEYNEGISLSYTGGDYPDGAETGWCYYSPIEEGNPYTKVRLNSISAIPSYLSIEDITVSYIDGVSADGTKRERLFTLDETTRQQIFNFVQQYEELINESRYRLDMTFLDSYIDVCVVDWQDNENIIESAQIPYSIPTNLIFNCKDYKYLDCNYIDHPVEPNITISKLGFKKEN